MNKFTLSIFNNSIGRAVKNHHLLKIFSGLAHGDNILDYGSGYTPYKELAETKFKNYFTAEFFATSSKIYKNKSDFIINNDESTNCDGNFFDCVLITEVLEHVYKPVSALSEIHRILKPEGIIIGTVPFTMNEHDQPYDYYRYTVYSLRRMLEDSNFRNINIIHAGDGIGSSIHLISRIFNIFPKFFNKIKLSIIAKFISLFIIRIPEYIYFIAYISGLKPGKFAYFRVQPLGYVFTARK